MRNSIVFNEGSSRSVFGIVIVQPTPLADGSIQPGQVSRSRLTAVTRSELFCQKNSSTDYK
jgi:hypothetical protein